MKFDIARALRKKVINAGGTVKDFERLVELSDQLAKRGNFDPNAILMIILDSFGSKFDRENIIKQLKINCGEFDFLPRGAE